MQARLGSTRLPGKVLREVLPGRTMLDLTIERLHACRKLSKIVVAVPDTKADIPVAEEAKRASAEVVLGPEEDVLTRYLIAARAFKADMVVRVTSDCPLIDPAVIDLHIERMGSAWDRADFTTNMLKQSFPLGLAVEAFPIDTLVRLDRLSQTSHLREHVTTLVYERPEWFAIESVFDRKDQSALRWTVDYPADFEFICSIYKHLYKPGVIFSEQDILTFLESHADIGKINAQAAR